MSFWRPEDDPLLVWWARPGKGSGHWWVYVSVVSVKILSSSPLLKPALGDVGIQSFSSVIAVFFSYCIILPRIACSLVQISSHISLFDEVHDLAVQSLPNRYPLDLP